MKIDCNLHDVKEIEPLASGVYSVRCSGVKMVQSREKKTDGIELELTFLDPGTEWTPEKPRTLKSTLWKSEKSGWNYFKVKEACEAFGVEYDDTGFDTDHFLNAEAKVSVEQTAGKRQNGEEYIRNEIQNFLKP